MTRDSSIRTAEEAVEDSKRRFLEESESRKPSVHQEALGLSFLNLQNIYSVFLTMWFCTMAIVAFFALPGIIEIDKHNRNIYMGSAVIVTGLAILGILIISAFHQERNRFLSAQHMRDINIPWIVYIIGALGFAFSFSILETEIEDDIGSDIFDDDDSFTTAKFEGKVTEAIIYGFFISIVIIAMPWQAKAVFSHMKPEMAGPKTKFTSDVRKAIENGRDYEDEEEEEEHHPRRDNNRGKAKASSSRTSGKKSQKKDPYASRKSSRQSAFSSSSSRTVRTDYS